MLSIHQKITQQQKLTPQQIQYQKLLQLNTMALEQRIKTELEMNPFLEESTEEEMVQELREEKQDDDSGDNESNNDEEFDIEDFMNDDEIDEIKSSRQSENETSRPVPRSRKTLVERLIEQVELMDLPEEEILLGKEIIYNLDKDGYFREGLKNILDYLKTFEGIDISIERAEKVLKQIQRLDPVGIACRNLQECLIVQLENSDFDPYYTYLAIKILNEGFNDFSAKRYEAIQKNFNLSKETLKKVIELIRKLNPKPGAGEIESDEANQITPDFIIEKVDDNYIITLNDRAMPSVTINQEYLNLVEANKGKRKLTSQERETKNFLKEKLESARWFIASIKQRRETLLKIMRAIFEKQYEFFENGPHFLKPMIYKDIADEIGMDISTISRVVNGKYVQSPQGIHELKYFFSEGLKTDEGEEVSNKHIKELIKEIIDNEPKNAPYSDDKIASMLKSKGIRIARRTVAKYREQMMIPVARLRKEL